MSSRPEAQSLGAQRVISAALARTEEMDCLVSVVVLDAGGNMAALARQDGTAATATTIALNKANTALTVCSSTDVFAGAVQGNSMLVTSLAAQEGIALFVGGVPLMYDGVVIGAIGVSGARDGKDLPIAQAGAAIMSS